MLTAGIALRDVEALTDLVACNVLLRFVASYTGDTTEGGGFCLRSGSLTMRAGLRLASRKRYGKRASTSWPPRSVWSGRATASRLPGRVDRPQPVTTS